MAETEREPQGKISSFCQDGGCVEVDKVDVAVRGRFDHRIRITGTDADTVLLFTRAEWEAFIAGVKNNEFDWDQL